MSLTALCCRRSIVLKIAAAADKAGVDWRVPQSDPMLFLKRVAAGQPRFALITNENLENPALFTNIRASSPDTSIIVCLTSQSILTKSLWAMLDNLEFDVLCTVNELTDCLLTLKAGRFYHSSLIETHVGYEPKETLPGWNDLTPTERRVLKLMAEGRTVMQIADSLGISKKTVNNHKVNISQKLNVTGGPGSLTRFVLAQRERITALLA